jgi:hypothetical protein
MSRNIIMVKFILFFPFYPNLLRDLLSNGYQLLSQGMKRPYIEGGQLIPFSDMLKKDWTRTFSRWWSFVLQSPGIWHCVALRMNTNISEQRATFFRTENEGSIFLQNVGIKWQIWV